MHLAKMVVVINITLALCGCATSPKPGDITHARVITVVGEWLYQKVRSNNQSEKLNNPHRTQAIHDAINAGVSIEDVREGRLVICSCRYGSNSGMGFIVLLPKGVILPHGDRVELELEAGLQSYAGHPGNLSVFRRVLPERPQGRTDCFPDNG
jgi:hypothetical protein